MRFRDGKRRITPGGYGMGAVARIRRSERACGNEKESDVKPWFNVRKAAQVSAFFALREGGRINVLKLAKLVYLANRLAMEKFDFPLLNDNLVSMEHGPVTSMTLDCVNGYLRHRDWDKFITGRENYEIGLVKSALSLEDLDEFSKADLEALEETWSKFGRMEKWELRDYTHEHCPEWEDPDGSSQPIPYQRVFKFLNKRESELLEQRVIQQRDIATILADDC